MELKKFLTLSVMTLLLSSCSFLPSFKKAPPEVVVKTVQVKVPIKHPTPPAPINLESVNWYVVSPKNLEEFLQRIEKEGNGVFFAMTVDDYENMSFNMQEIRRWINQTKQILIYYKNIDKDPEEKKKEAAAAITEKKEETTSE